MNPENNDKDVEFNIEEVEQVIAPSISSDFGDDCNARPTPRHCESCPCYMSAE